MVKYRGAQLLSSPARAALFNRGARGVLILSSDRQHRARRTIGEGLNMDLNFITAIELNALIRKREIKPSQAAAPAVAPLRNLNRSLGAFCAMRRDKAMAEARGRDERVARREPIGPLAGVPIAVKDLEDVAQMATTYGSRAFRDNLASADSIEVARLRSAGAIVIGKT